MLQEVYEEKRNIIMSMITGDWQEALSDEFRKDYYKKLYTFVKNEYNSCVVYPPADDIFNAFHFTPLKSVKVLILGQDPYHEVNQAHGLSFQFFRVILYLSHYRIYIKNYSLILGAIIQTMVSLKSGLTREYLC